MGDAKGLLPQALASVNLAKRKGRQEMLASLHLGYPAARFDPLASASSGAATPGRRGGRSNITWLDRGRRLRRCSASRHDPQLHTVFLAETTVDHHDSTLIDSTLSHQVIPGSRAQQVRLSDAAGATTIGDDVGSA